LPAPVQNDAIHRYTADVSDDDQEFEAAMSQMGVELNGDELTPKEEKKTRALKLSVDNTAADAEFEAAMNEFFEPQSVTPAAPAPDTEIKPKAPISVDDSAADSEFENTIASLDRVADKDAPQETSSPSDKPVWETLRKRRKLVLDDILDLHGATREESLTRLEGFIYESQKTGLKHVGIVTGKGIHSPDQQSILRPEVENWLFSDGAKYVKSVADAPRAQGGRGMLIVTLK
jgi:DNA-nicking Smr family endonuclease